MKKKTSSIWAPKFPFYFLLLLIFAGVTALLGEYVIAAAEAVVALIFFAVSHRRNVRNRKKMTQYLEKLEVNVDQATRTGMLDCPLPVVVFRPDTDEIIWSNKKFLKISGEKERLFDLKMSAAVPGFDSRWLMEGKTVCPDDIRLNGRTYQMFGQMVRMSGDSGVMATTYWVDITEFSEIKRDFQNTRTVVAVLLLDNYEDSMKSLDESTRSRILSEVSQQFAQWGEEAHGIFLRLERDRYLFLFERQYLEKFKAEKFSILDEVRAIEMPNHIPVTMTIGVGVDGDTLEEMYQFANLSVEMALSRGGDQVVLKNKFTFEFIGGRAKEAEKRTKVKSRVMASALGELIADASCLFVIGHKNPDMDAVGAAAGICAVARKKGVPAYIIRETGPTPADDLYQKIEKISEYDGRFLNAQDALLEMDSRSLLVVVDTNRPDQVQSPELLSSCNKTAVIDHHRRAASYIERATFNFHEPYASSASEMVTELISYIMDPVDLLKGEAEALMAGMMLDTKNFTIRTGARTFEAAAFLRQAGADTAQVKKLFQNDLKDTIVKYGIIENARLYHQDIAIASVNYSVGRVTAAQAADELLNIVGINTSFVIYPEGEQIFLSARSLNETNVQAIVETLGGGGNGNAAGAQITGKTVGEVYRALTASIDQYFEGRKDTDEVS